MIKQIEAEIVALMSNYGVEDLIPAIVDDSLVTTIEDDLLAYVKKDPAAHNDVDYVFYTYPSFRAVMSYRVANRLYYHDAHSKKLRYVARKISERAKVMTGIEIHPAARIGKRFVIDHGIGTVIGETTVIGDDCYILQCVIMGALGIANNADEIRHPTLGNNVEVGAFVRILGKIRIGNNVKISPFSIVRQDISDNHCVVIVNQCQIVKNSK